VPIWMIGGPAVVGSGTPPAFHRRNRQSRRLARLLIHIRIGFAIRKNILTSLPLALAPYNCRLRVRSLQRSGSGTGSTGAT